MVDLVKIRKKKAEKKKEEEAAASAAAAATAPVASSAPAPAATAAKAEPPAKPAPEAKPRPEPEPAPAADPQPAPRPASETQAPKSSKLERFKAEAGQRRDFKQTVEEVTAGDVLELLTFAMAGEQYAIDIERIVEIVTPRPVTRIPNADPSVVGIISLRGTIVTLVDVRGKLRHAGAPVESEDTRIVVIDFQSEMVGFVVDRVLRVVKTTAAEIEAHPVVHSTELDESVRGVFRAGGALTILLDLDKLLDHRALAATGER